MLATKRTFNLLHAPWIPCLTSRGVSCELGLLEVLERAGELRDIADPSPLVRISLYRLLLAVLYRTQKVENQLEWNLLWEQGLDLIAIREYLKQWEKNFDLFSDTAPFYQRADLQLDKATPLTKFSHEYAAGHNKQLFDHSGDGDPPAMSTAQAARLLVVCQGWAIGGGLSGGGRPRYTSAVLPKGASVVPLGETLAETLILNLVHLTDLRGVPRAIAPSGLADTAAWERAGSEMVEARSVEGAADYLTWQSRYIKLVPEPAGPLYFAWYTQGEKMAASEAADAVIDPFHAYQKDGEKCFPRGISAERAAWRDLDSLLCSFADTETKYQKSCAALTVIGQARHKYGDSFPAIIPVLVGGIAIPGGQPPPDLWCGDVFRIPTALLREDEQKVQERLRKALGDARAAQDILRSAVRFYANEFLKHENGSFDKDAAKKFADSLCREADFWAALETPFHALLRRIADDDYATHERSWLKTLRHAARDAFKSSLASQHNTGRHLRARTVASGFFNSRKKGINSIVPEEGNADE